MRTNLDRADAPGVDEARSLGWRAPTLLFLALFVVFGLTAARASASVDVRAAAIEGWHIASSGSPWLEGLLDKRSPGDVQRLDEHSRENPWLNEVPNGHVVADRMAGPVIISVPVYWLSGRSLGITRFALWPSGVAASFVTAGTCVLMLLALRRRLGRPLATAVSLGFALATPTWTVSADGPWTHTVTQFGLAGAAYASSRRSWWWTGAFLGIGIFGRPHLALVAAVLGLGMSWSLRSLRPAVQVGVPSLVAVAVLLMWNRWMFGVWSVASAGYTAHTDYLAHGFPALNPVTNVMGFLVSPGRGFLVWSPVFLLLLPAARRAWRVLPPWTGWLALGGVLYTAVQLRLDIFTGGEAFYGYRVGLELLTCITPLFACALPSVGRAGRLLVPFVVALQVAAMLFGAVNEDLLPAVDVWHDNVFLLALRATPVPMALWIAVCAVVGLLGARAAGLWSPSRPQPLSGYRRPLEPVD